MGIYLFYPVCCCISGVPGISVCISAPDSFFEHEGSGKYDDRAVAVLFAEGRKAFLFSGEFQICSYVKIILEIIRKHLDLMAHERRI